MAEKHVKFIMLKLKSIKYIQAHISHTFRFLRRAACISWITWVNQTDSPAFCLYQIQDATLQHLTNELQKEKEAPKKTENSAELLRTQGALNAALAKLSNTEHQLQTNNTMMKELVRTLEETREELAREKSYVAQAFDNDEELIRIKDELQKAEERCKELEKEISSLNQVIEDSQAKRNTQAEETDNIMATEMAVLAKQIEAAKGEMHHAKAELETFKGECKEKESQLEKMKKEFGEKVTELDDAKKDICDKMAALDDMKKRVTEKETQLKTIQEENLKTTAVPQRQLKSPQLDK